MALTNAKRRATGCPAGFALAISLILSQAAFALDQVPGPDHAVPPPPAVTPVPAKSGQGTAGLGQAGPGKTEATAVTPGSPAPPAFSPQCEVPASDLAAPAPLPNLAKALDEHRTVNILTIGSSSSASLGEAAGVKSYPVQVTDILQTALTGVSVEITNRGMGGEVAETSADRIRSEASIKKPDLVLWQLGTNDALARVDPGEFTDVVKSTIDWLRSNDIDVVLVGLQYTSRFAKDESYVAIRDALMQISNDEKVLYVRRYDAMRYIAQTRANLHLMDRDNFHLSDLGTQCMAEHIARAMIASLFVKRFRPNPD